MRQRRPWDQVLLSLHVLHCVSGLWLRQRQLCCNLCIHRGVVCAVLTIYGAPKMSYILSQKHNQLFVNSLLPPVEQARALLNGYRICDNRTYADNYRVYLQELDT